VRIFDRSKKIRTDDEIAKSEIDINKVLGIDDWTMVIDGFADPFVNTCFITDDKIYICVFHNGHEEMKHYHFIWDTKASQICGKPVSVVL